MKKPNIIANSINFELLRESSSIGKIYELSPEDAGLLAPHIPDHPETLFIAYSGINITGSKGTLIIPGNQVAIEWVREERNLQPNELELNMYRYVFGLTAQGRCVGYEEYDFKSTSENDQVGDHWMTLDELCRRYFK